MENAGQPPVTGPSEEDKAEQQPLKSSTRIEQRNNVTFGRITAPCSHGRLTHTV